MAQPGAPPGVTITPDKPRQPGAPPGVTITPDGAGAAPKANPLTADPAMKGIQGLSEYIARLISGVASIPERSGEAAANASKSTLTPEMMGGPVDAALLAIGKTPFAGAGADTARLAGLGARNAEAGAAGEAAVADAVRPPGPWDAGGAVQGEVVGQRGVANALAETPKPPAPGGTRPPPMPAEVAAAVEKDIPAAKPVTLQAQAQKIEAMLKAGGFSSQEQAAILQTYKKATPPADVPGAPATGGPLPDFGRSAGPKSSVTPTVKPPETQAGLSPEVQAVLDTLSKSLPESVMSVLMRAGVRGAANTVAPGSGKLLTAALKSAKIYRFLQGVGKASGTPSRLSALQRMIPKVALNKETGALLQKVVSAANASRSVPSGERL